MAVCMYIITCVMLRCCDALMLCVCVMSFLAHKNYKTNKTICTKRTWQYCFYRGETDFTGSVIKRQCGWNWISAANIEEKNEWICERWMNAPMHRDWKQNKFCDFFFSLFYGRANKDDNRSILWWLALVWMTFEFQQEIIWPQLTSIISQLCSLLIGCQGTYEHGQNLEFRHR